MNITLGIADDHQLFLKSLSLLITSLEDFTIVIEAMNGKDLIEKLESKKIEPDIILLDIRMKNNDGGEICRRIKDNPSTCDIKVILFSANDNLSSIEKRCGADASLPKPYDKKLARQTFEKVLR